MSVQAVLLPVFVLVALTFALLVGLGVVRARARQAGEVRERDVVDNVDNWPDSSRRFNNAYGNVLALPTLFYALVAFALFTSKADMLFVVMSWLYVAARCVQAFVHVSGGPLLMRGAAFAVSMLILFAMWGIFAVRILFAA